MCRTIPSTIDISMSSTSVDAPTSFTIRLEWQLVGKEGKATTIPQNSVFCVPAEILRVSPYDHNVYTMGDKWLMLHSHLIKRGHPTVDLGNKAYIFFSQHCYDSLKIAIPDLVAPDPRLVDPSQSYGFPHGYALQNA